MDAIKKHEKVMDKLSAELESIEISLAEESLYTEQSRKAELQEVLKRQGECKNQLEEAEMSWLESQEALDAAE